MIRATVVVAAMAVIGLVCDRVEAGASCWDGKSASYTQFQYLEGGLLVHVVKVDRGSDAAAEAFWPDYDWSYQIRSAACTGKKLGKDCDAERSRFVQIFWDQMSQDWRDDSVGYLQNSKNRCGLSGTTPRELWIDANSSTTKYACHLANFGNHHLVEAEVSVSNDKFLDERANLGGLLDDMMFSSKQDVPCNEPSTVTGMCGRDVLIFGTVVADNNHACGKPEVHPVHAVVTEAASPSERGAAYDVFMFADYGKAAGYGIALPFGKIGEYWNRNHIQNGVREPYFELDPTFVPDDADAFLSRRATPDTVSFAAMTCASRSLVTVHGQGRVGEVAAPTIATSATAVPPLVTGACPEITFNAEFTRQSEIVAGGQQSGDGEFVKGGFAASRLQADWTLTDITHWGTVKKTRSGLGIAPGGAAMLVYYELKAESHGRRTVNGVVGLPEHLDAIEWCLPPAAIVVGEPPPRGSNRPSELSLSCTTGRARGKTAVTFYVAAPAKWRGSPIVVPGFSISVGATARAKGRPLSWKRNVVIVESQSRLTPNAPAAKYRVPPHGDPEQYARDQVKSATTPAVAAPAPRRLP